jgi:Tfp pilus assembly pilus retraction ATPase PilT
MARDLRKLLETSLAKGAWGMSLRSGQPPVVYFARNQKLEEGEQLTPDEVTSLLRELMNSREVRRFREDGKIYFKRAFEGGAEILGAAKAEKAGIRVELRRMAKLKLREHEFF